MSHLFNCGHAVHLFAIDDDDNELVAAANDQRDSDLFQIVLSPPISARVSPQ